MPMHFDEFLIFKNWFNQILAHRLIDGALFHFEGR